MWKKKSLFTKVQYVQKKKEEIDDKTETLHTTTLYVYMLTHTKDLDGIALISIGIKDKSQE